jgi:hypothetical protein
MDFTAPPPEEFAPWTPKGGWKILLAKST